MESFCADNGLCVFIGFFFSLGQLWHPMKTYDLKCMSQEREYKEALEAFNEKNKEKVQLITKLMEVSVKYFSCSDRKMQELHFLILGSLSSQSALWLFYRMNSWWAKARS